MEKKLSMRDLAKKLDVSQAHISKMESDENLPSLTLLFQMAEVFDVHINYFFDIEGMGELETNINLGIDTNDKEVLSEDDIKKAVEFVKELKNGKFDIGKLNDINL